MLCPSRPNPAHSNERDQSLTNGVYFWLDGVAVGTALSSHGVGSPPAQIPAGATNALGSSLGFWRRNAAIARDV